MCHNVLGQVPQHVPAPQVQNLGTAMPNIQAGLVAPPPTSVSAQLPPVEEVQQQPQQPQQQPQQQQQPDDAAPDVHLDSGFNDEQHEPEPEIQEQPQEPGV